MVPEHEGDLDRESSDPELSFPPRELTTEEFSVDSPSVGTSIGPYVIEKLLGRGAFSQVWKASRSDSDRQFAIKLGVNFGGGKFTNRLHDIHSVPHHSRISPDEVPADAFIRREDKLCVLGLSKHRVDTLIFREAERLLGVQDLGFVKLHEVIEHNHRPALVLDYILGETLREKLRALKSVRLNWLLEATRTLSRLAQTTDIKHHGDLKPENIIITPEGKVVLIDPALHLGNPEIHVTSNAYNPLLRKDEGADVMGLGLILYEILTGHLPYLDGPWKHAGRKEDREELSLDKAFFLSHPPVEEFNEDVPEALRQIIYKSTHHENYTLANLRKDLIDFICS